MYTHRREKYVFKVERNNASYKYYIITQGENLNGTIKRIS